jgi:hypothetical protein
MNENTNEKQFKGILTVILRKDSPMIHSGDSPSYRTVRLKLTALQRRALALKLTHAEGGGQFFEAISQAILE